MSIFSWILTIPQFIEKLLASIRKDYLNLDTTAKAWIDSAIKFGNVLKTYIQNPGSAGLVVGDLITILEGVLGTGTVSLIVDVLNEVLIDCGIIATAFSDPKEALSALMRHLSTFSGTAFGKELFKVVSTVAMKLTGITDNNELMAIVAVAYKLFFSTTPAVVSPVAPATPDTTAKLAEAEVQTVPLVSNPSEADKEAFAEEMRNTPVNQNQVPSVTPQTTTSPG